MPDDTITAADNVHDVVRGGPGRFVDEERPSRASNVFRLMLFAT